jgi:adenine-specific DNA-methyltransferase
MTHRPSPSKPEASRPVSRLTDLLREVQQRDPQLGTDLAAEVAALSGRRSFGLNFERHTPETVELPGRPVRRGDKVRFLAERGESPTSVDQRLWRVSRLQGGHANRVATLITLITSDGLHETAERPAENLVVVAEFRDPIYPGLKSTGKIELGGDKPFHTVINAENYHALQALVYTHEGKVDAIYIDPPYNTGAKDWKYNNDYVDGEDIYRHSKWLAFMERRLKMAKRLLNPDNSVLILTVDEKEYLRAGLLLQQIFQGCKVQMISSLINPASSARKGEFGRTDEYLFFVYFGDGGPQPLELDPNWFGKTSSKRKNKMRWQELSRRGDNGRRTARPNLFYPIFVLNDGSKIHSIGEAIARDEDRLNTIAPEGTVAIWPIRADGTDGTWGRNPSSLREILSRGYVRLGGFTAGGMAVYHMAKGEQVKVAEGLFDVTGHRADGSIVVDDSDYKTALVPGTQWNIPSHDSSTYGSALLRRFLPDRRFPFPKSLYAVEDALRFFVADNPEALVVDFFGGSGTTTHAVMRLNRQDGGHRRSIVVTNNEVSADEQTKLRTRGLRPGDPEWERFGICDYITNPRLVAAVGGTTLDGEPVKGDYKFSDEFPMSEGFEENVEFFTLTYEAPRTVAHNRAFTAVASLLWLKAGARGRRIESATDSFDVADTYGVLFDLDSSHEFLTAIQKAESVRMAFIVTDDDLSYQMVCAELPQRVESARLYESYLTNFAINTGRE